MGTVTINIDDQTEKKFRETVKKTLGQGKGKLGQAVTEALAKWAKEKQQEEIANRQLSILEKGFDMGPILYKKRDELHERT